MAPAANRLVEQVAALRKHHGRAAPPPVRDPYGLMLWENCAYLVDDERRARVYGRLVDAVGLDPQALLDVPVKALARLVAADGGMHPERRATKLQRCAELALAIGVDELRRAVKTDEALARRYLKRFPGIGDPGAAKVLLFNGRGSGLAADSNVLRVLVRLGWGTGSKDYARTWRSAAEAIAPHVRPDAAWRLQAHQLLRRHGQELCKHKQPRCDECPLANRCPSAGCG